MDETGDSEKKKRMSAGLYISCPAQIKGALTGALDMGYHFIVTQITHPNYFRELTGCKYPPAIGRTDRVLTSSEWTRLVVGNSTSKCLKIIIHQVFLFQPN